LSWNSFAHSKNIKSLRDLSLSGIVGIEQSGYTFKEAQTCTFIEKISVSYLLLILEEILKVTQLPTTTFSILSIGAHREGSLF
jgi:hypothetical protein